MNSDLKDLHQEVQTCDTCCSDELCKKHLIKRTQIHQRIQVQGESA